MLKLLYIQLDKRRETRERKCNKINHKRQNKQWTALVGSIKQRKKFDYNMMGG